MRVVVATSFVVSRGSGGGGSVEEAVSLWVDSSAEELSFYVGVPIVLDLIVRSSR